MIRIKDFLSTRKKADNAAFIVVLLFSFTALIAAFTLSVEKIQKLMNPKVELSCSINLVLDCGKVMETAQSHVFGFPNMFIGLMAYPILIAVALLGLSGVRLPRWYMRTANIGILLGAVFAYWLFFNSLYVIEILCPWCLVVTFSTTLILAAFTHINMRNNVWSFKKGTDARIQKFLAGGYDKLVTFGWIILLIALVFAKFGTTLFA